MLALCIAAVASPCTDGDLNLNGALVAMGHLPETELCPGFIHYPAHRRLREIGATAWPKPFPDFRDGSLQRELRRALRFSSAASAPSSNETTSTPPTLPLEIDRV